MMSLTQARRAAVRAIRRSHKAFHAKWSAADDRDFFLWARRYREADAKAVAALNRLYAVEARWTEKFLAKQYKIQTTIEPRTLESTLRRYSAGYSSSALPVDYIRLKL